MISGTISPFPNCCSVWVLSGLYPSSSSSRTTIKPGPFSEQGYPDNTIVAISQDNGQQYEKDFRESGFIPVATVRSRYSSNHPLTIWVKAKGDDLTILDGKKKKAA